uniref:G-protein coupled receptors family 1 profile domain-containing protein n=1 Tax=Taeniopygia guttata TaxID=59729 RepID=A0A674H6B2_TAEGU
KGRGLGPESSPGHCLFLPGCPQSPSHYSHGLDDSCEIYVTDVAIDGVTLLICLCGLVGNGVVLWLLGFHIRRNPITVYILNLAIADFIFLLSMIPSSVLYLLEDASCSTVVPLKYLRPLLLLSLFSYNMGLYLLTAISIERCGSILFPLWYRCRRPQCLSWVVCALLWALCIVVMVVVISLCLSQEYEHCRVALISMHSLSFLIFVSPMVISNVILFIKVQCGSKRRQPKRLYIVIFLTVLFFLLFVVPLSLCNFLQQFSPSCVPSQVVFLLALPLSLCNFLQQFSPSCVPSQVVFLLACINSSINPFIYFLVGSCWRHCSMVSLQVAFQRATVVPPAVLSMLPAPPGIPGRVSTPGHSALLLPNKS